MGIAETIALSMGIAWASGINLYAAIVMLGLLGTTGNIDLPPDLLILQNPLVIAAAGFMYAVEFCADKVPGVDTGWDTLHTFIRIPAGAVLAAGAVGDVGAGAQVAALIIGGGLAGATHATKAGSRALINTSPSPSPTGPPRSPRTLLCWADCGWRCITRGSSSGYWRHSFC